MPSVELSLPTGWRFLERLERTVKIGTAEVEVRVAGLCAGTVDSSIVLTGSAADCQRDPMRRAYFELLERICVWRASLATGTFPLFDREHRMRDHVNASAVFPKTDAPQTQRYSLSNGAAVHSSWHEATRRAHLELVERDRVLRSWYGGPTPTEIAFCWDDWLGQSLASVLRRLRADFELTFVEFRPSRLPPTQPELPPKDRHSVGGLFGLPLGGGAPLFYGFGSSRDIRGALCQAASEAVQRLAFLWDEEPVLHEPSPAPTPSFHQDYYLWPGARARLENWLSPGKEGRGFTCPTDVPIDRQAEACRRALRFVDLAAYGETAFSDGPLYVAKAYDEGAFPLIFGEWHPWVGRRGGDDLRVHPVA